MESDLSIVRAPWCRLYAEGPESDAFEWVHDRIVR